MRRSETAKCRKILADARTIVLEKVECGQYLRCKIDGFKDVRTDEVVDQPQTIIDSMVSFNGVRCRLPFGRGCLLNGKTMFRGADARLVSGNCGRVRGAIVMDRTAEVVIGNGFYSGPKIRMKAQETNIVVGGEGIIYDCVKMKFVHTTRKRSAIAGLVSKSVFLSP